MIINVNDIATSPERREREDKKINKCGTSSSRRCLAVPA
jgi:hypothetical protein